MQAADFRDHIKADAAVLGSEGFLRHNGPPNNDLDDIQIKKTAIKNAMTTIVVADSSKASSCALMEYAPWKDIDYLVTDESFPEAERARVAEDTDVIIVPTQTDSVQSSAGSPA